MDYLSILRSKEARSYCAAAREYGKWCNKSDDAPEDVIDRYFKSLSAYHALLRRKNIKFPKPLYQYDPEDKTTWRFKDTNGKGGKFTKALDNPDFRYKHLFQGRETIINGIDCRLYIL